MIKVKIYDSETDFPIVVMELPFYPKVGERVTIETAYGPREYVVDKLKYHIAKYTKHSYVNLYVYEV